MTTQNYGNCKFCGAENVKNPKTGKVFCSEKCWLKNKNQSAVPQKQEPNWEEIRERKEESMSFLNSKNNAAILLAAAIRVGQLTLEDALRMYEQVAKTIYEIDGKE
jgi:uncharacterized Zn finger protein (UPF0148 family)